MKDRFADAKQAIEYFTRKEIVAARGDARSSRARRPSVELKFRNVAAAAT